MREYVREYASSVLTVAVLSLTQVTAQDLVKGATGTLIASSFKEVNVDSIAPGPEARHVFFRPLVATRQRNRDIEKLLQQQRHRNKSKASKRGSAQKGRIRPKSLTIVNQDEVIEAGPYQNFEIPNMGALPLNTDDDVFLADLFSDENSTEQNPVSTQKVSPKLSSKNAKPGIPQNLESAANSVVFILSRSRRDLTSNPSDVQVSISSEVKSLLPVPSVKDTDDVRPSSDMMLMLSKLNSNRQIGDTPRNHSRDTKDSANKTSDGDESMETAETVLFRPLFVHRWQKAQKNRRRQLQTRPQNRPKKKPQRQQPRPQQRPTTRPQQRPQQALRPQRPAQSTSQKKKKPQSTRRAQYYYVAAAGPMGQWVYYPIYYF